MTKRCQQRSPNTPIHRMKFSNELKEYVFGKIDDRLKSTTPTSLKTMFGVDIERLSFARFDQKSSESSLKEFAFQECAALKEAESAIHTHPWIALIAAEKHQIAAKALNVGTSDFHDMEDKTFWQNTTALCQRIVENSKSKVDVETSDACELLVRLQCCEKELLSADESLQAACVKFKQLLPPLKPVAPHGCILFLALLAASMFFWNSPASDIVEWVWPVSVVLFASAIAIFLSNFAQQMKFAEWQQHHARAF
jgi:hypothetical protein